MSEEDNFDASPELEDFINLSIGMSLDNLRKQGSLIPMVVSVQNNEFALGALAVDSSEVMNAAAKHIAALPAETDRYALLFDGKIAIGDQTSHAIIAQAGERGGAHGYTVFQVYDPKTFDAVGGSEYGGRADQLLRR